MDLNLISVTLAGILLCVGTVGNILAIITVTNKHCKKSSYTVYLAALAVADILALYTIVFALPWKVGTVSIDLKAISAVYCKLHLFLVGVFSSVSLWLIVVLALERSFAVYFPFKAKAVCKPKKAFVVTALLVTFSVVLNVHYIYGNQLQSAISAGNDTSKLNATENMDRDKSVGLKPLTAVVSGSMNNTDGDSGVGETSTADEMLDQLPEREMMTNNSTAMPSLERGDTDLSLAPALNAVTSIPGNNSVPLSRECLRSLNKTSLNQNGECVSVECDGGQFGDVISAATCHSSTLKTIDPPVETSQSNFCNSSVMPNNASETGNCSAELGRIDDDSHFDNQAMNSSEPTTGPNKQNQPLITNTCGFVDESYANFYRWMLMVEGNLLFILPVLIIVTANTATWIKVHRQSRENLSSAANNLLRRTRHVLVLTTLISISYIVFVAPLLILYVIEALQAEDYDSPVEFGETWTVPQIVAGMFYLSNHAFNFFMYILSAKRFRNDLKAAFCKPQ